MIKEELPREKALANGVINLTNRDLLAILIRSGTKQQGVLEVVDELLCTLNGLSGLCDCTYEQLIQVKGIHTVKALELLSAIELGKRLSLSEIKRSDLMNNAKSIASYFNKKIGFLQQEHFVVALLDNKNRLIHEETLFIGTLNASVVHNRDIFKLAIHYSAASIIVLHNHPSGDCIPSENDILVTQSIEQIANVMNIALLDHIIVGKNNYFSFREHQLLF